MFVTKYHDYWSNASQVQKNVYFKKCQASLMKNASNKNENVNKIKIGSEIYISLVITQTLPLQKWYWLRKSTLKWALIKQSLRKIHDIMAPGKMFAWSSWRKYLFGRSTLKWSVRTIHFECSKNIRFNGPSLSKSTFELSLDKYSFRKSRSLKNKHWLSKYLKKYQ